MRSIMLPQSELVVSMRSIRAIRSTCNIDALTTELPKYLSLAKDAAFDINDVGDYSEGVLRWRVGLGIIPR